MANGLNKEHLNLNLNLSASRRRKMLPCTEEEVEALFYFISNLYLTLYPIRTLSIPFPNFTAVHGVGVAP